MPLPPIFSKASPAAEREAGFQFDAVERSFDVGARQPDTIDTATCHSRLTELLCHRLPLVLCHRHPSVGKEQSDGQTDRANRLELGFPHGILLVSVGYVVSPRPAAGQCGFRDCRRRLVRDGEAGADIDFAQHISIGPCGIAGAV